MAYLLALLPESLRDKVITLEKLGVHDLAWEKRDLLAIIEILKTEKVGILGGDVLTRQGNDISFNYDNWHCDQKINESNSDFSMRSIEATLKYINRYPDPENGTILYTIGIQ